MELEPTLVLRCPSSEQTPLVCAYCCFLPSGCLRLFFFFFFGAVVCTPRQTCSAAYRLAPRTWPGPAVICQPHLLQAPTRRLHPGTEVPTVRMMRHRWGRSSVTAQRLLWKRGLGGNAHPGALRRTNAHLPEESGWGRPGCFLFTGCASRSRGRSLPPLPTASVLGSGAPKWSMGGIR